jgi:hypothetical protein
MTALTSKRSFSHMIRTNKEIDAAGAISQNAQASGEGVISAADGKLPTTSSTIPGIKFHPT